MLAKLTALLTSKVALAAIGGTLVVGTTVTVAAAATGHLPTTVDIPGITNSQQNDTHGDTNDNGHHAHTIAIEGTLSAYTAGSNGQASTITVTGKADDQGDDQGDTQDGNQNGDQNTSGSTSTTVGGSISANDGASSTPTTTPGTPTTGQGGTSTTPGGTSVSGATSTSTGSTSPAAGTPTTSDPKCTISSPVTIIVNSGTKYTGTVRDEAGLAGAIGRQIQVQATATDCKNLTAWKVTVGGKGDQHGKALEGKVGTVNASGNTGSFTVQPDQGNAVTVNVTATTKFAGGVHGLGDLKSGMAVGVLGTQQSDGSVNADLVVAEGGDGHGGNGNGNGNGGSSQGQRTEIGGTIASLGTTNGSNSFVVTTEDNHNVTVVVGAGTVYYGDAHGFGDLKAGMHVAAAGTLQQDGSLQATYVAAQAASGHD